jgi:hypothetical protein
VIGHRHHIVEVHRDSSSGVSAERDVDRADIGLAAVGADDAPGRRSTTSLSTGSTVRHPCG